MKKDILLKGIGASPGIVIGKALIVEHGKPDFTHYRLANDKEIREEISVSNPSIVIAAREYHFSRSQSF